MGSESDVTTGACCARLEFESNSPRAKQTAKRNMGASGGGKVKNLHSATQSIANPATFPDRIRRPDIGSRRRPQNPAAENSRRALSTRRIGPPATYDSADKP